MTLVVGTVTGIEPAVASSRLVTTAAPLSGARRIGNVPGTQKLSIAVVLNPLNAVGLSQFVTSVSTPGSPFYGQYLTPDQYLQRFAPTASIVGLVESFLTSGGLAITSVTGNHQVIDATGTVSQLTSLLGTTFGYYTDGTRTFYANDNPIALPNNVMSLVTTVVGLDSRTVETPMASTGPTSGLSPTQVNSAYRFSQLGQTGSGQTVALWEFDGYTPVDLTTYNSQYGLSGPTASTVPVDGASYDSAPGNGRFEVELDSEVARAIAPAATQLVYEAPNSGTGQVDMANKILSDSKATVISVSWGACEQDTSTAIMTAVNNVFTQAAAQGISIFSASGDNGSRDCTNSASGSGVSAVDFPGSSGYDTSVGGTSLTLGANGVYGSETAWSLGGGGVSVQFTRPAWQTGSGSMRTVPDVASEADPNTGFATYTGGSWVLAGGTSAAAPTWAGFALLYNQKALAAGRPKLGFANPALYQIGSGSGRASAFHDVTSGSNGAYTAGIGYDNVTGWGSPIGDGLATALFAATTANTVAVTGPGNQSTVVGATVSLAIKATDSGSSTLTYAATGLPAGLSINATTGVISGKPTATGTSTVTVTATDTTKVSGSTSFTWTITSVACAAGNKLTNSGFESGATGWTASTGVIGQHAPAEPAHAGTWDAVLDGKGTAHTDTLSQSVAIPGGCTITVSLALHVDTAETTKTAKNDTLTIKLGSTTLGTYSNLNAATGYVTYTYTVTGLASQTAALTFTGTENSGLQTSFVVDDVSLSAG